MPQLLTRRRLGGGLAVLFVGAALVAAYEWMNWPDVARLVDEHPDTTAFMERYLERRAEAPELPPLRHHWVPAARVSVHLKRAVVAAEDMEFFHHEGFSTAEMRSALREALSGGRVRGASTITQQLAKNLWLSPSRNPLRKVREAVLTRQLETHLSKSRILEIYVNVVELGSGIYGVEAAARHYFGGSAAELTQRQAAMLAAGLPRPSTWHPGSASAAYARYVDDILGRMTRAEFLWSYVSGPVPVAPTPFLLDSSVVSPIAPPDSGLVLPPVTPDSGRGAPPTARDRGRAERSTVADPSDFG